MDAFVYNYATSACLHNSSHDCRKPREASKEKIGTEAKSKQPETSVSSCEPWSRDSRHSETSSCNWQLRQIQLIQYTNRRICDQLVTTVIHGYFVNSPSSNGSVFHVLPHQPSFGRLFEGFGLTNRWACQSQRCHRRRKAVAKMPHQQDF